MKLTVELSGAANLKSALGVSGSTRHINEGIGARAEELVRSHLLALNTRSTNTDFYARASRSVSASANADTAIIKIDTAGIRLRYIGGRVVPGKTVSSATGKPTRALAIPTANVPVKNHLRLLPSRIPDLAFQRAKKNAGGGKTIGYLVEGMEITILRGQHAGQKRMVPKPGGKLMFVLRTETKHQADDKILPTDAELLDAARAAIDEYFRTTI